LGHEVGLAFVRLDAQIPPDGGKIIRQRTVARNGKKFDGEGFVQRHEHRTLYDRV